TTQPFPWRDLPVPFLWPAALLACITNTELLGCLLPFFQRCPLGIAGEEIKKRQKTWRRNSAARMEKMGMTEELIDAMMDHPMILWFLLSPPWLHVLTKSVLTFVIFL
ncbi:hypothetical protein HID58_056581, partial [Brassica napus]